MVFRQYFAFLCRTLVEIIFVQICCLNFSDKEEISAKWDRNGGNNWKKKVPCLLPWDLI